MFEPFPKLTRFSHDWTITEKIDGTNAQVLILPRAEWPALAADDCGPPEGCLTTVGDYAVFAGSRNRLLTVGKGDNHGFAQFVQERAQQFVELLGEGRHFGEWFGQGIGPRGYGVNPKEFALFNAIRWSDQELPDRVRTVPLIYTGRIADFALIDNTLDSLKENGSLVTPGFMNPEGIVMYHGPSRTAFKRTFDYDEAGKWAEKEARS